MNLGKLNMINKILGIGINDANYVVKRSERVGTGSKVVWRCPYYSKWESMLHRCYTQGDRTPDNSCYIRTEVCEEWLTFSNFKSWMEEQDWEGKQLDKDLLGDGTLYSPDTCCFINENLNYFLINSNRANTGVTKTTHGKFNAKCRNPFNGKREHIGNYDTELEAHLAWREVKAQHATNLAKTETNPLIKKALEMKYKTKDI